MHDAVTRWDHINILKSGFGPVNKVKAIIVASIFDGAVFFKGIGVEASMFNRQGVIND